MVYNFILSSFLYAAVSLNNGRINSITSLKDLRNLEKNFCLLPPDNKRRTVGSCCVYVVFRGTCKVKFRIKLYLNAKFSVLPAC